MERVGQRRRRSRREGGRRLLSGTNTTLIDLSDAEQFCSEPSPLEQVRRVYAGLEPGARLEVRSRVTEHAFAVRAWCRKQGIEMLRDERDGTTNVLVLVRSA
jgi:TusA-related sulfurtransferase